MKSVGMAIALMAAGATFAAANAQPAVQWETTGLKTPESALAVPAEGFAYVSNIAGKPTDKDGNGFISKVSLADGKIIALEGAKGLDAPKGLALAGGKLFTSDIDKLAGSWRSTMRRGQRSSTTSPPMRRAMSTSPIPTPAPFGVSPAASSRNGSTIRR